MLLKVGRAAGWALLATIFVYIVSQFWDKELTILRSLEKGTTQQIGNATYMSTHGGKYVAYNPLWTDGRESTISPHDSFQVLTGIVRDLLARGKLDEALETVNSIENEESKDCIRYQMVVFLLAPPRPLIPSPQDPEREESTLKRDRHISDLKEQIEKFEKEMNPILSQYSTARVLIAGNLLMHAMTPEAGWGLLAHSILALGKPDFKTLDERIQTLVAEGERSKRTLASLSNDKDEQEKAKTRERMGPALRIVSCMKDKLHKAESLKLISQTQKEHFPKESDENLKEAASLASTAKWKTTEEKTSFFFLVIVAIGAFLGKLLYDFCNNATKPFAEYVGNKGVEKLVSKRAEPNGQLPAVPAGNGKTEVIAPTN